MTATKTAQDRAEAERRAKAKAAREAVGSTERRRRLAVRAGVAGAVALAIGGVVTLGALTGKQNVVHSAASAASEAEAIAARAGTGLPPWPNAEDPEAATRAAGITPVHGEGTAEHYHAHLDVFVNGVEVPVAAGIGVDDAAQLMSPLHTHDGDGLVHVEAPTVGTPYYLGQLFREWDVALSATQLGGLRTDVGNTLTAYVNGSEVNGNPATIRLAAHQQITLVYGNPAAKVDIPSSYDFGDA